MTLLIINETVRIEIQNSGNVQIQFYLAPTKKADGTMTKAKWSGGKSNYGRLDDALRALLDRWAYHIPKEKLSIQELLDRINKFEEKVLLAL